METIKVQVGLLNLEITKRDLDLWLHDGFKFKVENLNFVDTFHSNSYKAWCIKLFKSIEDINSFIASAINEYQYRYTDNKLTQNQFVSI